MLANDGATGRITLEWADGEFAFELRAKEIEELQRLCGYTDKSGNRIPVGIAVIYQRLNLGTWSADDVLQTIRLALIGGGMNAVEAKRKLDLYGLPFRAGQPSGSEATAIAIIGAAMFGYIDAVKDAPPGEAEAPKAT